MREIIREDKPASVDTSSLGFSASFSRSSPLFQRYELSPRVSFPRLLSAIFLLPAVSFDLSRASRNERRLIARETNAEPRGISKISPRSGRYLESNLLIRECRDSWYFRKSSRASGRGTSRLIGDYENGTFRYINFTGSLFNAMLNIVFECPRFLEICEISRISPVFTSAANTTDNRA